MGRRSLPPARTRGSCEAKSWQSTWRPDAERLIATPDWRLVSRIAWLPDGSGLLVNAQESAGEASNQMFFVGYPSGEVRRITSDLSSYSGLSLCAGRQSFVCIRNELRATIWTQPVADAAKAVAVATDAGTDDGIHGMAWTPDGRIVFTTEASGNPDVWIMASDGSRRVQLTSAPGQDISPRVTPDGKYVVFVSDRDGGLQAVADGSRWQRRDAPLRGSRWLVDAGRFRLTANGCITARRPANRAACRSTAAPSTAVFAAGASVSLPPGFHEPMPSPDGATVAGHYSEAAARGERIALIAAGRRPGKADVQRPGERDLGAGRPGTHLHRHPCRHIEPDAPAHCRRGGGADNEICQRADLHLRAHA